LKRWTPPPGAEVLCTDAAKAAMDSLLDQLKLTGQIGADEAEDLEGLFQILEQIKRGESVEGEVISGHSTWIKIRSGNKTATLEHEGASSIVWILTFG